MNVALTDPGSLIGALEEVEEIHSHTGARVDTIFEDLGLVAAVASGRSGLAFTNARGGCASDVGWTRLAGFVSNMTCQDQ